MEWKKISDSKPIKGLPVLVYRRGGLSELRLATLSFPYDNNAIYNPQIIVWKPINNVSSYWNPSPDDWDRIGLSDMWTYIKIPSDGGTYG